MMHRNTEDESRKKANGRRARVTPTARVLMLGRSRPSLERLMELLGESGYDVRLAPQWAAAEYTDWDMPDLLLIDLVDGFAILEERPADMGGPGPPIVVIADANRLQDATRAVELGAVDYIAEPLLEQDALFRLAMQLKRGRRLHDEIDHPPAIVAPKHAPARGQRYQSALERCTKALLVPADDRAAQVQVLSRTLQCLVDAMKLNSITVYRYSYDAQAGLYASAFADAYAPGVESVFDIPELQCIPWALVHEEARSTLQDGRPYSGLIEKLYADSPEVLRIAPERATYSTLHIPIMVHGHWWGFITVNRRQAARRWGGTKVAILRAAAAMVAQAIGQWEARAVVHASEHGLRTLIANFPHGGVCVFDQDLRYLVASSAPAGNGLSAAQIEGKTLWEVVTPATAARLEPLYRATLAGTAPPIVEEEFHGRTYSLQPAALRDARGSVVAGMIIAIDMTTQKEVESALRTSQEQHTHETLQRHADELAGLNEIARLLANTTQFPGSLDTAAGAIQTLFRAARVTIGLYSPIVERAAVDAYSLPDAVAVLSQRETEPLTRAGGRLVVRQGDPAPGKSIARMLRALHVEGCASAVIVSLPSRSGSIGVLAIGREQPAGMSSPTDIDLAMAVASLTAAYVENSYLHRQARQAAVIQERQRLSRELHDSVAQVLYSIGLLGEAWAMAAASGELKNVAGKFRNLSSAALKSHRQMRLLVYQLRQPDLIEHGLIAALTRRLESVERRAKVKPVLRVHGTLPKLPPDLEEQLFFIAQEALNNSLRHGNATSIAADIRVADESIVLLVQDNGSGFDPGAPAGGVGLSSMHERAASINGSLSIFSAPGEGTVVELLAPLPNQQ